jgi:hypothetical protein
MARPRDRHGVRRRCRAALTILCLAAVAAAVPAGRYLVFEYNHGDRQIVQRLFASLLP